MDQGQPIISLGTLSTLLISAEGSKLHLCTWAACFYGFDPFLGSRDAQKHLWRFKQIG